MFSGLGAVMKAVLIYLSADFSLSLSNRLWNWFTQLFGNPVGLLDSPGVVGLQRAAVLLASSALPVILIIQAMRNSGSAALGVAQEPPEAVLRRAVVAGISVSGIAIYVAFATELANLLRTVIGLAPMSSNLNLFKALFDVALGNDWLSILLLLIFLLAAGAAVIQRFIFSVETALLFIVGALVAATRAVDEQSPAWQTWKHEIRAVLITPLIQLVILYLIALRIGQVDQTQWTETGERWVWSLALVYLLWNTPRWARKFTYQVGVGHGIAGTGAHMSRMAVTQLIVRGIAGGS